MPLEKGGRADKQGNQYELNCIIFELLNVLDETNSSVMIEPLGTDEKATDIIVTKPNGKRELQQCKARNGSFDKWNIGDLKSLNLFEIWKMHLNRDSNINVALVSPLTCTFLVDLYNRACNSNDNAKDFLNVQIRKSSKDFQRFYDRFCKEMKIDINDDIDVLKSIHYLKRILYKQISEYELKQSINQKIQYLFCNQVETVYNSLLSFVVTQEIYAKEITSTVLLAYLEKESLELRLIDKDRRVIPVLNELNKFYRYNFRPLRGRLIYRKEFGECITALKQEKNIIISGNAGCGKSSCTEAVIDYCENQYIPYVAIKLDQRMPTGSSSSWGEELGLPSSIPHSLHKAAMNDKAVIILDQLDALRWTQANSRAAINVCTELIREVKRLNLERRKPLLIIFVCRTYDLEHDNAIKSLFMESNEKKNNWKIIKINPFEDELVKNIAGEIYNQLTLKEKSLLRVPSNLYIWQHLHKLEKDNGGLCFLTTTQLVSEWFTQICKYGARENLTAEGLENTKNAIVDILERSGRLYIPKTILRVDLSCLEFLLSFEIIIEQNGNISFAHQSILDCFIAQNMMRKYYYLNESIEQIIGTKEQQTLSRRYQVQLFLQNLLDVDSQSFIDVGNRLVESADIRYYIKYLFYELLGQIEFPDENITNFIIYNSKKEKLNDDFLNIVIYSREQYIRILMKFGVLELWTNSAEKRRLVIKLLRSISSKLDDEDILFIEKHELIEECNEMELAGFFSRDIFADSEEMFNLRMVIYDKHPNLIRYIHINQELMNKDSDIRIVKFIVLLLKLRLSEFQLDYSSEENLMQAARYLEVEHADYILNELLDYLPKEDNKIKYGEWSNFMFEKKNLERVIVELIKKSLIKICHEVPDKFWEYYLPILNNSYCIFKEIVLASLEALPRKYSDQVIRHLYSDLNNRAIEYTSGANNMLAMVKKVIAKHVYTCSDAEFLNFESSIIGYVSPQIVSWYREKREYNKNNGYDSKYRSFWGELQYELLPYLPANRIHNSTRDLIEILNRKFQGVQTRYHNNNGHSGWVRSAIANKKISIKQWRKIITNEKFNKRNERSWKEVPGGFIENSISAFSSDFSSAVSQQPEEMIRLVLENKNNVVPQFIDSLYSGLAMAETLENVSLEYIVQLVTTFPCNLESDRASYFCNIVQKYDTATWPSNIKEILKNITINHCNPKLGEPNVTTPEDLNMKSAYMLESNALNCTRGQGMSAIGHLLWKDKNLLDYFRDTIECVLRDENPAVRFSALFALWPAFNIDREWAIERIINLYDSDIRTIRYSESGRMLLTLYPKFKDRVLNIIERCYASDDKELIRIGSQCCCLFYIRHKEFENIVLGNVLKSPEQVQEIVHTAVIYLKSAEYREEAKKIILYYKNTNTDIEMSLSYMFDEEYLDANKDAEFLKAFLQTRISRLTIRGFILFLEKNAMSIMDYADILIKQCEEILNLSNEELGQYWGIVDEVSKLIFQLYDETANVKNVELKKLSFKCIDLWDIMFERQLGSVRSISKELLNR